MPKEKDGHDKDGAGQPGSTPPRGTLTGAPLVAAFLVLAAWMAFLVVMAWVGASDATKDAQWSRLMTVLGSFEAVAFAAAGAVFGVTVQRQRVQEANKRADDAKEAAADADTRAEEARGETRQARTEAHRNAEVAANGKALAAAVKTQGALLGKLARAGGGQAAALGLTGGVNDELVALAERLFPD